MVVDNEERRVFIDNGRLVPVYLDDGNYYKINVRSKLNGEDKIWELVPDDQLLSLEEAQERYPEEFI